MKDWRRIGRGGFTLAELLVAMGVLLVLLAVVVPSFSRLLAIGRRAQCVLNLRRIGEAYGACKADGRLTDVGPLEAQAWSQLLKRYVGRQVEVYICPEDHDPDVVGVPNVRVRIWNGDAWLYEVDLFTVYPYWLEGSHADFDYRPGVWKVNDEYYQSLGIDHGNSFADAPNFSYSPFDNQLPEYTPGDDPKVYWYLMEDQRSGNEFGDAAGDGSLNDLHVQVTEQPGGTWECTFFRDPASIYHYDLLPPDDGEEIEWIGSRGNNGPYTFKAGDFVSYGMNSYVGRMSPGVRKIVAIDYEAQVCWVGPAAASQSDGYGDLVAPRHLGKLNALFSNGAVETMAPEEIDPEISELHERYWAPAR